VLTSQGSQVQSLPRPPFKAPLRHCLSGVFYAHWVGVCRRSALLHSGRSGHSNQLAVAAGRRLCANSGRFRLPSIFPEADGSIEAAGLAIEATGVVTGEATYGRLKVTTGGVVEGKIKRKREAEQMPELVDTEPVGGEQGKGARSEAPKGRSTGLFRGTGPTKTST
jgi:hypothetical protein